MSDDNRNLDSEDYRNSHKRKGTDYDEAISSNRFDAYMDKWEGYHLAHVLTRLFPAQIPRYLDFACGTGRITQRVEPHANESFGVDVSENMLKVALSKCRTTRFVCTDLTQGDADFGHFDLVTSFRFFGNAQDELRSSALLAINQRLLPRGYLIINNHRNPCSFLGVLNRHAESIQKMDLSHAKLKTLLQRHGFEVVYQRPIGFWIYRHKIMNAEFLESARANMLERAFQHSWFAPFSPDALIVARKIV
jgi:predicted TPR repeat methyltransferase